MGKFFRDGIHPVWAAFISVYLLATAVTATYWLFTESGPIGWLCHWQATTLFDGHWYPKLTAVLWLVASLVPALLIKVAVERIFGRRVTGARVRSSGPLG